MISSKETKIGVGIYYVGGVADPNTHSPCELSARREAHQTWQNLPPYDSRIKLITRLVDVQCVNPDCSNKGFIYQALDLSPLVQQSNKPKMGLSSPSQECLRSKNIDITGLHRNGPIVGPCVVCHQYTTEIISKANEK